MSAPPAKKIKKSSTMPKLVEREGQSDQEGMAPPEKKTISMVVKKWKRHQTEQFSAVHRIKGYPWRLRLFVGEFGGREMELWCDKSNEADLWMCTATVKALFNSNIREQTRSFHSWGKYAQAASVRVGGMEEFDPYTHIIDFAAHNKIQTVGAVLEVEIEVDIDGEKWNHPILNSLEPLDGILVIGEKKINVHKASLASQSSFFDKLFFGDFKEKNMAEIPIGDVEYEEFNNLLKIIYRIDGITLTDENVCNILRLADKFDLKIVESVCTNYLLTKSSSLSIHQKLLISEENNLPLLKERLIKRYTTPLLKDLVESPMWEALSKETTKALMKKCISLAEPPSRSIYDEDDSFLEARSDSDSD